MFAISENFTAAATDYLYLLERRYPQKAALKLVGDRFQLFGTERSMLYRGIVASTQVNNRKNKRLEKIKRNSILQIDGYNVIRMIGSYLLGRAVFISMDGFLRDASEMHRSTLKTEILDKTMSILIEYLKQAHIDEVYFYIDEPVSKSGELAAQINSLFNIKDIKGEALTTYSPDKILIQTNFGVVCTADSAIIDNCSVNIFDLPRAILNLYFNPVFFDFTKLF